MSLVRQQCLNVFFEAQQQPLLTMLCWTQVSSKVVLLLIANFDVILFVAAPLLFTAHAA